MRKQLNILLLLPLMLVAAASCKKDGSDTTASLRFHVSETGPVFSQETKSAHTASLATADNKVKVLNLYAWNNGSTRKQDIMENVELTYSGAAWSYAGSPIYWPGWTVGNYKVTACYPSDAPLSGSLTDGYSFTVPTDYTATPDLMFAYYAYSDNTSSPTPFNGYGEVTLPFSHMLSSIQLTLETDSDTEQGISASGIGLALASYPSRQISGSAAATWLSPTVAVQDYAFTYSDIAVPASHAQVTPLLHSTSGAELTSGNSYIQIIPVPSASSSLVVSVTYNTNTYTATITGQEFARGVNYKIALTLSGSGGVNFKIMSSTAGSFRTEASFTINGSSSAGGFKYEESFTIGSSTSTGSFKSVSDFSSGGSSAGSFTEI